MPDHDDEVLTRLKKLSTQLDAAQAATEETAALIGKSKRTSQGVQKTVRAHETSKKPRKHKTSKKRKRPTRKKKR